MQIVARYESVVIAASNAAGAGAAASVGAGGPCPADGESADATVGRARWSWCRSGRAECAQPTDDGGATDTRRAVGATASSAAGTVGHVRQPGKRSKTL